MYFADDPVAVVEPQGKGRCLAVISLGCRIGTVEGIIPQEFPGTGGGYVVPGGIDRSDRQAGISYGNPVPYRTQVCLGGVRGEGKQISPSLLEPFKFFGRGGPVFGIQHHWLEPGVGGIRDPDVPQQPQVEPVFCSSFNLGEVECRGEGELVGIDVPERLPAGDAGAHGFQVLLGSPGVQPAKTFRTVAGS